MALTESNMIELGTKAPDFTLTDTVSNKQISLKDVATNKGLVVMFISNHCPFVVHVNPEIKRLSDDYLSKGIGFVAISSNDIEAYPDDAPELMGDLAKKEGFNFPYLFDPSQETARAYDAACTPDFYIFDGAQNLVYRGRLDASRPGNDKPLNGADIRAALDDLLQGNPILQKQYPSAGCNIKWK